MPPSIESINNIYQMQSKRQKIARVKIAHDYYEHVNNAMKFVYRKLINANVSLLDNDIYEKLRHLRFRIKHYPLPFSYHHNLINEINDLISLNWHVYPYLQNEFHTIQKDILPKLINSLDNPLLEYLRELAFDLSIIEPFDSNIHVIMYRNNRIINDVQNLLQDNKLDQCIHIIRESQYLDMETYDHVVVIGAPRLYSDAIFQSRRSMHLTLLYTSGSSIKFPRQNVLTQYPKLNNSPNIQEEFDDVADIIDENIDENIDDLPSFIDWKRIIKEITDEDSGELSLKINATVLEFADGYYTFIESAPNEGIQALDIDELASNRGEGLYILKRRDMRHGQYVLLRTNEDVDYVETIANQILGSKAQFLRTQLKEWKQRLSTLIQSNEMDVLINQLLENGVTSTACYPLNIRRWADDSSIKPQDSNNFRAILKVTGYSDNQMEEIIRNAKLIVDAHIQAGQKVRKLLREQITGQTFNPKKLDSRIDFELPGIGAQISAFQIEKVDNRSVEVARWRLHKLFRDK